MKQKNCGGDICCGRHRGMHRFMEACLLALLCEGEGYGYALSSRLNEFGFSEEEINAGTLYRTLRNMEADGLLQSGWESGGAGPRRRVYGITQRGREELGEWARLLSSRKKRIEALLERYEKCRAAGKGNT